MPLTKKQLQILEAILFLIRRGELPTVREVGALAGLRSPATVSKHLKALAAEKLISISGKSRGIRIADPELLASILGDEVAADLLQEGGSQKNLPASSGQEAPRQETPSGRRSGSEMAATRARGTILQAHFPKLSDKTVGLPIVGRIAAGQPILTQADAPDSADPLQEPTLAIDPHMFAATGDLVALKVQGDSMIDAGILDGDYVIIRRQESVENGEIAAVLVNGEGTLKRMYHIKDSLQKSAARDKSAERSRSGSAGEDSAKRPSTREEIDALFDDDRVEDDSPTSFTCLEGKGSSADPLEETVRLKAANERFDPITIQASDQKEVLVFGKYVGLVRGDLRIL